MEMASAGATGCLEALQDLANACLAGWAFSRPLDLALLDHWPSLGAAWQPDRVQVLHRAGQAQAASHGELDGDTYHVHLLAPAPGAVEAGVRLLELAEHDARAAGATRLCGPTWRAARFYGGYVLGCEPYTPHWAADTISAFVQAGWRLSHPAVLLQRALDSSEPAALPAPYELAEAAAPAEFAARTVRFVARQRGEEVATCTARLFTGLRGLDGGPLGQVGFVGTGEPHRGRGLARGLVQHCLRRLAEWGAAEALIATGLDNYPALRAYEAVGFRRLANLNEWSKDLGGDRHA